MKAVMKKIAPYVSSLALLVIVSCSLLVFLGKQEFARYVWYTNISTIVWFVFSPWWLISEKR